MKAAGDILPGYSVCVLDMYFFKNLVQITKANGGVYDGVEKFVISADELEVIES